MIAKANRFHGHGSLRFVYTKGKTLRSSATAFKFVPNSRRSDYRLAVVVSKKVSKSAVVRNRIRRRVYESFRRQLTGIKQPYDMVFTVFHEQVAEIPPEELDKAVYDYLVQAEIIKA